jgi:hypothetical protein
LTAGSKRVSRGGRGSRERSAAQHPVEAPIGTISSL